MCTCILYIYIYIYRERDIDICIIHIWTKIVRVDRPGEPPVFRGGGDDTAD